MARKSFDLSNISTGVIVPIFVVVIIAFGYFVAWSQFSSLRESQALLKTVEAGVIDRETSLANVNKLLSDVESKRDSVVLLDGALPTSPDIPELLANLEFLVLQSGLVVSDLKIELAPILTSDDEKSPEAIANMGEILAEVSVVGQFPQLSAFILNVEHNLRLLDVQSIEFGTETAESDTQKYKVNIKTYYQKGK